MKLPKLNLTKLLRPKNIIYFNRRFRKLKPLTLDELIDIIFIAIPYAKKASQIGDEAKRVSNDWQTFKMLSELLLADIDQEKIKHAFAVLFSTTDEEIGKVNANDILMNLPIVIKYNNLYTIYMMLKRLGDNE